MNKLRMALRTTFSGWVFSTLWVFAAMPVTAVDYERAVPSRPPLPPSETVTIPATAFQPAPNARYEVSNGFLVTAGGYASFRYRLSLPAGALIQKVELIGSEPAGTGTMSLGLAWQDPPDQTWQWMTQVLTFQSRRESATSWANFPPEHKVSANHIYVLNLYMGPVPRGEDPAARRFSGARITFVRTAWL